MLPSETLIERSRASIQKISSINLIVVMFNMYLNDKLPNVISFLGLTAYCERIN